MKTIINAQMVPGQGIGGAESVLIGLVRALGQAGGRDQQVIVTNWQSPRWLDDHLGPNQEAATAPRPAGGVARRWLRPLGPVYRRVRPRPTWPELGVSGGFFESLGAEAAHFPFQDFVVCALPSIYNPHDLQHRHLPGFFTPADIAYRESLYPKACWIATRVVAATSWIRQDLIHQFGLPGDKISVIPWAPPTEAFEGLSTDVDLGRRFGISGNFALYPAMTWPHKNHIRLLQALAKVHEAGHADLQLVCTGSKNWHFPAVEQEIRRLGLERHVFFPGYVSPQELRALYAQARFAIHPSLYEAMSGIVLEAWKEGVPAAAAAVTSIPDQVQDAALLFNPMDPSDMARVMVRLTQDAGLRSELVRRGKKRLESYSWKATAQSYLDLYRTVADVHAASIH